MDKSIKNIYFLLVLLSSAKGLYVYTDKYFLLYLFVFGIVIFHKKFSCIPKILFVAITVWFIYFFINTIIIWSFHPYFMLTYVMYLVIAWLIVSEYKYALFEKYAQYIYYLSIISLVFYACEIFSYDALNRFMSFFDVNQGSGYNYKSIVLFTIPSEVDVYRMHKRNCGFAWEPGPFSSFVAIALFYSVFSCKNNAFQSKRNIILIITILTTQSSTGYLMMLIIGVGYFVVGKNNVLKRYLVGVIIFMLSIYVYQAVPFLQEKIKQESMQDISDIMRSSQIYKQNIKPGRFASFDLALRDFEKYPVAGIGGYKQLRSGTQGGMEVNIINGLGRILSVYGIIGSIIFLYMIYKSGKWLSDYYGYNNAYLYPIIFLVMGFGFGIIESPVICTLWLFPLFLNPQINNLTPYIFSKSRVIVNKASFI